MTSAKTHLLGYPGRLGHVQRIYNLGPAVESGRCMIHTEVAAVYEHFVDGDELIVTGPQPEWYDQLRHYGLRHKVSAEVLGNPYRLHQALMAIADITDKKAALVEAIRHNIFLRHHFAYGLLVVAEEAQRMGIQRVAAIEFGVWQGAGLKNLAGIGRVIEDCMGVGFDVYGFDTGAGMPPAEDWRDHPEIWHEGEMVMPDYRALQAELPDNCTLIIGQIADTIDDFCANHLSADVPLGFISFDMDYYSSTMQSLRVMENPADHYMPVMTLWVDDSYINIMQTHHAGEARALLDFNEAHPLRQFDFKVVRPGQSPMLWHYGIWFCHIFDHPARSGAAEMGDFNDFLMTNL